MQAADPRQDTFQQLRRAYPDSKLLIVSNTAGTASDKEYAEAALLERNTGVKVLRHATKVRVPIAFLCLAPPSINTKAYRNLAAKPK